MRVVLLAVLVLLGVASASTGDDALAKFAGAFQKSLAGQADDPFALGFHQQEMERNNRLAEQMVEAQETEPSALETQATAKSGIELLNSLKAKATKLRHEVDEKKEHLQEALENKVHDLEARIRRRKEQADQMKMHAEAEKDLEPRFRSMRADASMNRVGFVGTLYQKGKKMFQGLTGARDKLMAQKFEDCLACRLVWHQVEMDVSNARFIEDVQSSFEHNCLDAQKATIFFKGCEDMYDDMYAMTNDYMSGDFTVDKMCQRAKLCA